jgi:hypothetical protein
VDPVPDPLLLRKCGSAGNRIRTSGSVGRGRAGIHLQQPYESWRGDDKGARCMAGIAGPHYQSVALIHSSVLLVGKGEGGWTRLISLVCKRISVVKFKQVKT